MRNSVRLLALTSILMSLCCHASAQPTINTHVVDTTFVPDSVYQNMKNTFFNAAKFDGNDIKTAEDLVRKMPGAEMKDDVANVMWGGDWRIPTDDECQELIENCTCTMDSINGVKGFRVTSNVPGYTDRSIFFPAAGGDGIFLYWSSSLDNDRSDVANGIKYISRQYSCKYQS